VLAGPDEATPPPVAERARDRGPRGTRQAGQFLLRQRHRHVDHPVRGAPVPLGQVEQEVGQSLRAGGFGAAAERRVRVIPFLRHHPPVGAGGSRVAVEERVEAVVPHDQRSDGFDGLNRGVPASGGLTRDIPDDVTVAAQREQDLVTVLGRGQDLDPSGQQDEHVRGEIALQAHGRGGRVVPGKSEARQGISFILRKQRPESLPRSHPLHPRVTVGNALYGGKRVIADTGSNNEPLPGQ
jgi:hypothetical protein